MVCLAPPDFMPDTEDCCGFAYRTGSAVFRAKEMDANTLAASLQKVDELIKDEQQIVTYKLLSRKLGIHVNTSKQLPIQCEKAVERAVSSERPADVKVKESLSKAADVKKESPQKEDKKKKSNSLAAMFSNQMQRKKLKAEVESAAEVKNGQSEPAMDVRITEIDEEKTRSKPKEAKAKKEKKKRRRILSDSDDSDSEKDEQINDEILANMGSLEIDESEIVNVEDLDPINDGDLFQNKRKRKIVDRTIDGEDGYMETIKEVVYETDSDEEEGKIGRKQAKMEYTKKVVDLEPKRENGAKGNMKKQSSLLSFFKKK